MIRFMLVIRFGRVACLRLCIHFLNRSGKTVLFNIYEESIDRGAYNIIKELESNIMIFDGLTVHDRNMASNQKATVGK